MQPLLAKLKSAARRIPFARPLWHRIRPYLYGGRPADATSAWHQYLPGITNAIASVAAISREQARMKREHEAAIAELRQEIERLRSEIASRAPSSK
jgi:hypothetical protein